MALSLTNARKRKFERERSKKCGRERERKEERERGGERERKEEREIACSYLHAFDFLPSPLSPLNFDWLRNVEN